MSFSESETTARFENTACEVERAADHAPAFEPEPEIAPTSELVLGGEGKLSTPRAAQETPVTEASHPQKEELELKDLAARIKALKPALEALLLVSSEGVLAKDLAPFMHSSPDELELCFSELAEDYAARGAGMVLRKTASGWRLFTHPAYHDLVERYVLSWDTRKLSAQALETLAVIAYHQPATREHVRAIRGVNSDSTISSLVEKGLVRELGRAAKSNSILYGTTQAFLEKLGLQTLKDLPDLEQFAPSEEARERIRERLSEHKFDLGDVSEEAQASDEESLDPDDEALG